MHAWLGSSVQLIYPTAPLKLNPADVPGFEPDTSEPSQAYAWWRRDEERAEYMGLEDGLSSIASTLAEEGPVDGVIGFSQGACAAAMVASLLEPGREQAFRASADRPSLADRGVPFSPAFAQLDHPPLKFAIFYSGFKAPGYRYRAFYEPKLTTPTAHFIGSLDTVVDEARSLALVESCLGGESVSDNPDAKTFPIKYVTYHPGGHHVPTQRSYLQFVTGFIRKSCTKLPVAAYEPEAPATGD